MGGQKVPRSIAHRENRGQASPASPRGGLYTPAQWEKIVSLVKDQCFLDLLTFLWETGCRPMEARCVEARHVDLKNRLVVFPPSESKKGRERVIFMTDAAVEICDRLCRHQPDGPIFRNTQGRPWTKDAIACRFRRMKKKVNIKGLCAYGIRHSFATEGLKNGVDSLSLATIMGHTDVSMLARTYQHLANLPTPCL